MFSLHNTQDTQLLYCRTYYMCASKCAHVCKRLWMLVAQSVFKSSSVTPTVWPVCFHMETLVQDASRECSFCLVLQQSSHACTWTKATKSKSDVSLFVQSHVLKTTDHNITSQQIKCTLSEFFTQVFNLFVYSQNNLCINLCTCMHLFNNNERWACVCLTVCL